MPFSMHLTHESKLTCQSHCSRGKLITLAMTRQNTTLYFRATTHKRLINPDFYATDERIVIFGKTKPMSFSGDCLSYSSIC